MKYLILLLLILSSCTDKENTNQESTTQDMLIVFEVSEELQTKTKPLIASYDKGLDLILLETAYSTWYIGLVLDKHGFYSPDAEEQAMDYASGNYWNSNDNTYYYSRMTETNNIIYTLDSNLQDEALYDPSFKEKLSVADYNYIQRMLESDNISDNIEVNPEYLTYGELLYVGSITPLERIYIDPINNNKQYIKKLSPMSTNYYYVMPKTYKRINVPIEYPIYPAGLSYGYAVLTNTIDQEFIISGDSFHLKEY